MKFSQLMPWKHKSVVVICYLIWPCDIAVRITYLISHSSSLTYNTVIKGYFSGCVYIKIQYMYNTIQYNTCTIQYNTIHPLTAQVRACRYIHQLYTQLPTYTLHSPLMTLSDTPVAVLRDFHCMKIALSVKVLECFSSHFLYIYGP